MNLFEAVERRAISKAEAWLILMVRYNGMPDTPGHNGCSDCGSHHLGPVISDKLWGFIAGTNRRQKLCFACMECRYGRPIEKVDWKPVPWNDYRQAYLDKQES